MTRVLFAGGGTGGHLFPALAIADEIKRQVPDAAITFVGTKDKIEARVVPQRGYSFAPIWISGFRRKFTLNNLLFPAKVVVAIMQSFFLMKKVKPDVVIGTGGYVCGPPLYVATKMKIPTLIQEQNSYPGATTRKLAAYVNEVHISFEATRQYLRRSDNVRLSGNPTNAKLGTVTREEGAKLFNLNPNTKTILAFGGSLGAASINREIERILPELLKAGLQIIWQTGKIDFERINTKMQHKLSVDEKKQVRVHEFIEQMQFAYAASDVAVCRAGASTLAELAVVGLPSVLVPYPFAAADHQTENARSMVDQGAAVMIKDGELSKQLLSTVNELLADETRLAKMAAEARTLGKPDAAATIAQAALKLAKV